ncbi:MAG: hypothetical protein WA864_02310 [Acetobacteraceae bacterium]|jgi:hypothetical protein
MAAGPPGIVIARSEATKQARWFWQTYNRDCFVAPTFMRRSYRGSTRRSTWLELRRSRQCDSGLIITPSATLGSELALGNPQVASSGSLYGFTVNQYAAYDSRYLLASVLPRSTARSGWGQG